MDPTGQQGQTDLVSRRILYPLSLGFGSFSSFYLCLPVGIGVWSPNHLRMKIKSGSLGSWNGVSHLRPTGFELGPEWTKILRSYGSTNKQKKLVIPKVVLVRPLLKEERRT